MIVHRKFFNVRSGGTDKLVAMNKEFNSALADSWPALRAVRIYSPIETSHSALSFEYEFESVEDGQRFWSEVKDSPLWTAFIERCEEVMPPEGWGYIAEVWRLE